jgi:hypothetical protein
MYAILTTLLKTKKINPNLHDCGSVPVLPGHYTAIHHNQGHSPLKRKCCRIGMWFVHRCWNMFLNSGAVVASILYLNPIKSVSK